MSKSVSIIIPVFNTEVWMMEKCFESVIGQTYPVHELIIVDDGSDKSETVAFLERYADEHEQVTLFSIDHAGISAARNKGIEKCSGEYCCFLDSDDYYNPDFVEKLVSGITDKNPDIVFCGYSSVNHEGDTFLGTVPDNNTLMDPEKYPYYMVGCGSRLHRVEFLKEDNISFPVGCIEEDESFIDLTLAMTDNMSSVIGYGYNIRQTRNSFSRGIHRIYASGADQVPFDIYERVVKKIENQDDFKSKMLMHKLVFVMMWNSWLFCCNTNRDTKKEMNRMSVDFVRTKIRNLWKSAFFVNEGVSNTILVMLYCIGIKLRIDSINSLLFTKLFKLILLKRGR